MEVVKGLDVDKYMGRWYEIASFPSRFQPKNGVNTRATYTLNPDGTVHVLNETWSDGKRGFIEGTAYKSDPNSDEAKLKVKFYVPPFLPIIPVTGNYWVLYIDEDYRYVLIGEPSRTSLWVCLSPLSFVPFIYIFSFLRVTRIRWFVFMFFILIILDGFRACLAELKKRTIVIWG